PPPPPHTSSLPYPTLFRSLAEARESGNLANVPKLTRDLAFNLGGHVNHSIFWNNMSPDGGDKPVGELAAAIEDQFGSFDKFREQDRKSTRLNSSHVSISYA